MGFTQAFLNATMRFIVMADEHTDIHTSEDAGEMSWYLLPKNRKGEDETFSLFFYTHTDTLYRFTRALCFPTVNGSRNLFNNNAIDVNGHCEFKCWSDNDIIGNVSILNAAHDIDERCRQVGKIRIHALSLMLTHLRYSNSATNILGEFLTFKKESDSSTARFNELIRNQ